MKSYQTKGWNEGRAALYTTGGICLAEGVYLVNTGQFPWGLASIVVGACLIIAARLLSGPSTDNNKNP